MEYTSTGVEVRKMARIDMSNYFNSIHAENICMGIACNTPEKVGATDLGMVKFLERGDVNIE